MDVTLAAEWHIDEPRVRVAERDAQTALRTIAGKPVVPARARLRFGPGRTCEPIAWLLDRAIVRAEAAGLDPALLVVADGSAQAAEDIVRVRKAYGAADWIHSATCRVQIILRPARPLRDGRHRSSPATCTAGSRHAARRHAARRHAARRHAARRHAARRHAARRHAARRHAARRHAARRHAARRHAARRHAARRHAARRHAARRHAARRHAARRHAARRHAARRCAGGSGR